MDQEDLGRFGDARRAVVGGELLAAMQTKRTMCLNALANDRSQARQFGRFLDSDAVSIHEMVVHAGRLTGARVAGRHVLGLADTSELNFATQTGRKRGFGTVGNGIDIGVFLHPVIAVDAEQGGLIGLVSLEVMNRTGGKVADHKKRPADAKESRRWLSGTETAGTVLAEAAMITMVQDREGDIYDQFARSPKTVHLLVRAAQDRALDWVSCCSRSAPVGRNRRDGRSRWRPRRVGPDAPQPSQCGSAKWSCADRPRPTGPGANR